MNVSAYLVRQREGPWQKEHISHTFFVLNQELYIFCFANVHNSSAFGRNYKMRLQAILSRDKMDHFCILQVIKHWTVGRPRNEVNDNLRDHVLCVFNKRQYFLLGLK